MYTTRHYAHALLDLAQAKDMVAVVLADLERALVVLGGDPRITGKLSDRSRTQADRARAVATWAGDDLQPEVIHLLQLLATEGSLRRLTAVVSMFRRLAARRGLITDAQVTSARALDAAEQERLAAAIQEALDQTLLVRFAVEPELIGGLKIRVGSTVIDGSLTTRLSQLRNHLTQ